MGVYEGQLICDDSWCWLILASMNGFSHFNTLALFLHSHEGTGIVHASLRVIPVGIH